MSAARTYEMADIVLERGGRRLLDSVSLALNLSLIHI